MNIRTMAAAALARAAAWTMPSRAASPAWDAAGSGRRATGWQPSSESINSLLFASADALRRRSRDQARKNPWALKAIAAFAANAIGTGIKPQPKHPDAKFRQAIQQAWSEWTSEADAAGLTDFYGLQLLACRAVKEGGEVFARLRPRWGEDGLSVPLQIQLLEPEHVPLDLNQVLASGNVIRAGIEFDPLGRRVAYHMYREHPGERFQALGQETIRVPAAEVLHVFEPQRPGQIRGVSGLAPVLLRLYEFDQYEGGELVRKRDASQFSGFIRDQSGRVAIGEIEGEGATAAAETEMVKLEPGTFQKLLPGEEVQLAEGADMGEGYGEFMKWVLRAIAAGYGITYEQLTGDLSDVNFSSIRAGLVEFRRAVEAFQHSVFVFQFCRPVWRRWIADAVLAGALPVSAAEFRRDPKLWLAVKWAPQGWAWVDPEREIRAIVMAIRAGLMSRSEAVAAYGYDAEDIDAEIAADQERADALGLGFDSDGRRPAAGSPGGAPANQDQASQAPQEERKSA